MYKYPRLPNVYIEIRQDFLGREPFFGVQRLIFLPHVISEQNAENVRRSVRKKNSKSDLAIYQEFPNITLEV